MHCYAELQAPLIGAFAMTYLDSYYFRYCRLG